MIAYIGRSHEALPEAAKIGLEVARRFDAGDALADDVVEARKSCWHFIDDRRAQTGTEDRPCAAVRAVLCLLEDRVRPGIDADLLVEFFMECMEKFEGAHRDAKSLLRDIFPDRGDV